MAWMMSPGMRLARAARKPMEKGLPVDTVGGTVGGAGFCCKQEVGDSRFLIN